MGKWLNPHEFGFMRFGVNAPKVENVCGARFNPYYFEYHRDLFLYKLLSAYYIYMGLPM